MSHDHCDKKPCGVCRDELRIHELERQRDALLVALRGLLNLTEHGSHRTPVATARGVAYAAIAKAEGGS